MRLTHLITKELKEFLIQTGDYQQCMHNVSGDYYLGNHPYKNIDQLFLWVETAEGYNYWLGLYRRILSETKTYSNSTNT